jgi:MFS family permease
MNLTVNTGVSNSSVTTTGLDSGLPQVSNQRRWTIVGLLFSASMINYLDRAALSFALPLIALDLHLGPETKGLLLSSFFWSYAFMQVPIGWAADRFNLRWLYAGAFTLWSVAQGLTGLASGLAMLIGFRILLGIGESIYLPGGTKIVNLLFARNERGLPSGLFDFGTRTGLVLEGILIPWLLVHYVWRKTFMMIGFLALVWLIPWFLLFPSRLQSRRQPTEAIRELFEQPLQALTNRNLIGICLGFFCFDYYWYVLVTWLPDYLVNIRHLGIQKAGLFASIAFLTFGLSQPAGGWVADRLIQHGWDETRTRKGILTIGFLSGLLLIAAVRASDTRMAILFLMGACLVGLAQANISVILQSCAPQRDVGMWTGFENFFGNLAGVVAPLAIGFMIKRTGSYVPGFMVGSIVLVVGLLAYWFIVGELELPDADNTRKQHA